MKQIPQLDLMAAATYPVGNGTAAAVYQYPDGEIGVLCAEPWGFRFLQFNLG